MNNKFEKISINSFLKIIKQKAKIEYRILKQNHVYDQILINAYHQQNMEDTKMTLNQLAMIVKDGFESVNKKIDDVEHRLNEKIDSVENRLNSRIYNIEIRIDNIENDIKLIKKCPTIKRELRNDD